MLTRINSLKITVLLLGWLSLQSAALDHEFSQDHWFAGSTHVCLTQAAHFDDLVPNCNTLEIITNEHVSSYSISFAREYYTPQHYNPQNSRAPPALI